MPETIVAALREIAAVRVALDSLEARLVVRARANGATWSELGDPLGLSKQAVRKRHLADDPIFARRKKRAPTIDDYYAEMERALGIGSAARR